jgi:transposase-like protein
VLPLFALIRVVIVCPHCHREEHRLAPAVKKGMEAQCPHCHRRYRVTRIEPAIGRRR